MPPTATAGSPPAPPAKSNLFESRELANKLRAQTVACRVRHEKLGVRKALTREQMRAVAEAFDAESKVLTAAKKLIDTRDPVYRAVVNVRSRAAHYWKAHTTPYPEPGIRLILKERVVPFDAAMTNFRAELKQAAERLQEKYSELLNRAQNDLGVLFNPADYPTRIDTEFALEWDYPSVDPPAYLKELNPQLYEQECERIRGRFEEAVRLTEQAMLAQLHELVAHLAERLRGDVDGKPKTFRDTAVTKLNEFFEQFRSLSIGSSAELQNLVDRAQDAVKGVTADELRGNADARTGVADKLAEVQQAMDALMVNRPKRAINLEDAA